jgi:hypothetical protein
VGLALEILFLANSRKVWGRGLVFAGGGTYVAPRRGTESQRARPPRCEAAPPELKRRKARRGGFLERPGTASFSFTSARQPGVEEVCEDASPIRWSPEISPPSSCGGENRV